MKANRRFFQLAAVVAAALLVTVMANLVGASNGNGSAPVTVMNTPLPVTVGNESLSIGGTINAVQEGDWNVGLTGTGSVQFSPVEPYQVQVNGNFVIGDISAGKIIAIPPGKRLVIEYVTAWAAVPSGQNATFHLVADPSSSFTQYDFPAAAQGSFFGQDTFGMAEQVRLYAKENVGLFAQRSGSIGTGTLRFTISGYLVSE